MAIVEEDGTVVAGANSYVSEAELTAYATSRGFTLTLSTELLLIRAMDWIEVQKYKGTQLQCDQVLQWPRFNVVPRISCFIESDEIPTQLKNQQMYVAVGIDQGFDPTEYHDRSVKSEKNCANDVAEYLSGTLSKYEPSVMQNRFFELLRPRNGALRV